MPLSLRNTQYSGKGGHELSSLHNVMGIRRMDMVLGGPKRKMMKCACRKETEGVDKGLNREGSFEAGIWGWIGLHQMENHGEGHSGSGKHYVTETLRH